MSAKPERIRPNSFRVLVDLDPESAFEKLAQLPGIRIDPLNNYALGSIDAVAAAAARLSPQKTLLKFKHHPIGKLNPKLRHYQVLGVELLAAACMEAGGALLADEMGLGKTAQAIATMQALSVKKVFVVCPGMVRETWREDLAKWGESSVAILGPDTTKKAKAEWAKAPDCRWVVTSYELSNRAFEHTFLEGCQRLPDGLVLDEVHMLSGRRTARTARVREAAAQTRFRLGLTGTPFWNHPRDAWSLLDILVPGRPFGSQWDFDLAYCGAKLNEHGGWVNDGSTQAEEFKARLAYYMVRRMKADVLSEMPSITRQVIWCEPDKGATVAFHAAVLQRKAGSTSDAVEATLKGKMGEALRLARELKRFLLFTWQKQHAYALHKELDSTGTPCVLITGDINDAKRKALVRYAAEQRMGVVATIDSAGTGMDGLQHVASTGIFHALDWVPNKLAQAEARLHRLGQTAGVQWIYLAMQESIDQVIVDRVLGKLDQWHTIMGGERGMQKALEQKPTNGTAEQDALRSLYEDLEDGE